MNKPLSILTILLIIFTVVQTIVFIALLTAAVIETNTGSTSSNGTIKMLFVMILTLPLNLFLAVKSYKKDLQSAKEIKLGLNFKKGSLINKFSKNKGLLYLLGVILIIFGLFYWFQLRPSIARSQCVKTTRIKVEKRDIKNMEEAKFAYEFCLHSKGIK